jgi:glycosyltransferase involved in cell wall biosynthesis
MALYRDGKRRILPPLLFGAGVFLHLLRHGRRYDHVHLASFPFFPLIAAGLLRPLAGYRIGVDWHEVWSRDYWRAYLGAAGIVGWWVQALCARVPHIAFGFSRLHLGRLDALGRRGTHLTGEYAGAAHTPQPAFMPPVLVYAGRMIPEKRVPLFVEAVAIARQARPDLQARIFGDGPESAEVADRIAALGLGDAVALEGFVAADVLEDAMAGAAAIVQPSAREGYGMVVVEASARGVPAVVVAGEDNAATELVDEGVNGFVATDATPAALAAAMLRAVDGGAALRERTARWYADNAGRLSLAGSLDRILAAIGL